MKDFVKEQKEEEIERSKGGEGASDHSTFFLQYTCKDETPHKTADKKFMLWILAGLHANTVIIYVVAINCL